jgi:hypothetical protein
VNMKLARGLSPRATHENPLVTRRSKRLTWSSRDMYGMILDDAKARTLKAQMATMADTELRTHLKAARVSVKACPRSNHQQRVPVACPIGR